MIRFVLEEDLTHVLEGGPWSMDNRPFVIQRWSRNSKLEFERLSSIPVWIKFPNLPLHFWSTTCIGRIASLVGTPLYLDSPTALKTRTAFARVCVEMEAGCEFPNEVFVEIRNGDRIGVKVIYDWKPIACEHCNTFGHDGALCCKKPHKPLIPILANLSSPSKTSTMDVQAEFVLVKAKKTTMVDNCTNKDELGAPMTPSDGAIKETNSSVVGQANVASKPTPKHLLRLQQDHFQMILVPWNLTLKILQYLLVTCLVMMIKLKCQVLTRWIKQTLKNCPLLIQSIRN
ncbi:hypothetical protein QJS04_geneDACA014350 [Acorus gramineus]|uniref:DUF4283 domain-containing protein n=1 Tax=Acorus gramineus TaxID=55184 RepID=A0AAV9AMP2_ACOGR|nr:hypothetical protein QJS04_geneDACA014350 [Acorus gramineus]